MSKIQVIKRLSKEDFPKLDEKLLTTLNTIFEAQFNCLNNGIDFTNNMAGAILEVTTEKYQVVSASVLMKIAWPRQLPPKAVWIGNIQEVDATTSNVATSSAPAIEWYFDPANKQVCIKKLWGLTLDGTQTKRYRLTFVCVN